MLPVITDQLQFEANQQNQYKNIRNTTQNIQMTLPKYSTILYTVRYVPRQIIKQNWIFIAIIAM